MPFGASAQEERGIRSEIEDKHETEQQLRTKQKLLEDRREKNAKRTVSNLMTDLPCAIAQKCVSLPRSMR
jgi:hypothetical protein